MKIKFKAVFFGFLVDIVGSFTVGLLIISIFLGLYCVLQGIPLDEIETYLTSSLFSHIMTITIGLYFTFLGGVVAGKIAKSDEMLNASAVGIVGVLCYLVFWSNETPLWYNVIALIFTIPAAMLGGKLSMQKSAQTSSPPENV